MRVKIIKKETFDIKIYDAIDWDIHKECYIIHPKTKQRIYFWLKPNHWVKWSTDYDAYFNNKCKTIPWVKPGYTHPREIVIDKMYISYTQMNNIIDNMSEVKIQDKLFK